MSLFERSIVMIFISLAIIFGAIIGEYEKGLFWGLMALLFIKMYENDVS